MQQYFKNFFKYKGLLYELVKRDIKVKYRRSILGILWSILNPLLMMVVISVVFSQLFRFQIENYPIYLISGQIVYAFFAESTSMAMSSVFNNSALIKKVYIPKYIFPISQAISSFVNLLFSFVAIVVVMLVTNVKITIVIGLLPISLFYLLAFSIGIGLILAAYTVFFRDLVHIYSVLLTAWYYLTPFIYPESIVPVQYQFLLKYNPLYYFVKHFREIVIYGQVPSMDLNIICFSISIGALLIGMYVFYRKQDEFILYV